MAEPTTAAALTLAAATVAVPMLTIAGIPLGLRADMLIAGFSGSLVAIILLNTVPTRDDTWNELWRTTLRRMFVAVASSITAGYITPLAMLMANLPDPLVLGAAFSVGAGAQKMLMTVISRLRGPGSPE